MNQYVVSGFLGKVNRKSDKFGIMTLKELTRRKNREGVYEKGKTFWDILLFERDLNFIEQYVEEGRYCTVYGELVVDVVEGDQGKRKFYKVIPREIAWAPKGEERDAPPKEKVAPMNDDDQIPF